MTIVPCDYSHIIECDLVYSKKQSHISDDFCGKCLMARMVVEFQRLRVTGIQP